MDSRCRHFGICGGCSIQHLAYADQLARKQAALLEILPRELRKPGGPAASSLFVPVVDADTETPWGFRQTNARAAAVLQRCVTEAVTGAARVLDLYCGSGLFSLPLAAAGARVAGIDENRQAIRDAEINVRLNRIPDSRIRFISARVEDGLNRAAREAWDAVILDPPRQGCPQPVLSAVFRKIVPPRAVLISCDPERLAVELPVILAAGYRAERIEAVDMFPHTDHIETVVRFIRR